MSDEEIAISDEDGTMSDSEESIISEYQSAISDEGDTSGLVFGPQIARAKLPNPLGKNIRLRIELEGLRGLTQTDMSTQGSDARPSYYVQFSYTSHSGVATYVQSSRAQEGVKSLRGTVQWNEVLYLEGFELGFIDIVIFYSNHIPQLVTYITVRELLQQSELLFWAWASSDEIIGGTLCLSTSQVLDDPDKEDRDTHISSNPRAPGSNDFYVGPKAAHSAPTADITNSLHTILCQLSSLGQAVEPSKVGAHGNCMYWIQCYTYITYKRSLNYDSSHPRVNLLISSMVSTINAILLGASAYMQQTTECAMRIIDELYWATSIMADLVRDGESDYEHRNPEAELARLTLIFVIPAPTVGADSTSASSSRHAISGTVAKDILLLALDAIVQSSDVFPPLKSAAGGLLFFATSAEIASSNKKQVRDIYKRINCLAAALQRGTAKGNPLTPEHQEAIRTLADDIAALNDELNEIVTERKSRFKRFFAAKRHRNELQDVVTQLDTARVNYMMAMATLNATTIADVHGHVKAITLVLNASPVLAPGTRRADAVELTFSASRIEED